MVIRFSSWFYCTKFRADSQPDRDRMYSDLAEVVGITGAAMDTALAA